jgi:hypothetical protein
MIFKEMKKGDPSVFWAKAIKNKDLRWNKEGDNFEGQLFFDSEDY